MTTIITFALDVNGSVAKRKLVFRSSPDLKRKWAQKGTLTTHRSISGEMKLVECDQTKGFSWLYGSYLSSNIVIAR